MSVEKDDIRRRVIAREREMLAQAKSDILGCGDFLPVNRLAQHFNIRVEALTPALVKWEADNRIFSIDHEGCSLFPCYAFSTEPTLSPYPELKGILSILSPTKNSVSVRQRHLALSRKLAQQPIASCDHCHFLRDGARGTAMQHNHKTKFSLAE
ncbi:hypothetical protein CJF40_23115 [Pseudomonas lundensis]|nr:hypothetical protein CJF40_23115 [Pseudomonas lundensis]